MLFALPLPSQLPLQAVNVELLSFHDRPTGGPENIAVYVRVLRASGRRFLPAMGHHMSKNPPFTEQELTILRYMADGLTNKEIGDKLTFSQNTIKAKITDILDKLNVRRRSAAVAAAIRQGVIQ